MDAETPSYYAIIPANVRYDENLRDAEKLMYGEITTLSMKNGECWASNNYFANLYNVTPQAVSKWLKDLEANGYINISYEHQGKEIKKRIITLGGINTTLIGINTTFRGYQQKFKENNTSNNNTSIKENIKRKEPTLDEIKDYIQEKNLNVDAKQFYDYFTEMKWVDSKGNKVKNWKGKLLTWNSYKQPVKQVKQNTLTRDFGGLSKFYMNNEEE